MGALGELLLPPGVPRFLRFGIAPGKAKPGLYTFRLTIDGLDRTTDPGQIAIQVRVP